MKRNKEDLFHQFANNADQCISILNTDGYVVYMNNAFIRLFGCDPICEGMDRKMEDIYAGKEVGPEFADMIRSLSNGMVWDGKVKWKEENGKPILTDQKIFPVDVGGGTFVINTVMEIDDPVGKGKRFPDNDGKMDALIENIGDWVWEMDINGIHTYSNSAVKDILGYEVEEVVGYDTTKLWPEVTRNEKEFERHKKSLQSGKGWSGFQALFMSKNGEHKYLLSSGIPLHGPDGKLCGYRGIDRDITERVKQARELKKSKEKIESIISTAVEAIYMMDVKRRIEFISPAINQIVGFTPEEIIGKPLDHLVHPEDLPFLIDEIGRLSEGDVPMLTVEFRKRHIEKGWVTIRANMSPVKNENGKVESIVVVAQDITDMKQNEDRILQYNDLLKIINRILRHDLTNNLFMIKTALDHYQSMKDDRWIRSSERRIERSLDLIGQMKDLENIVSFRTPLRVMDVGDILKKISSGFDTPIINNCDCRVVADDAIYSVFENLIRNAITHGGTDRIEIKNRNGDNNTMIIEIIDFGKGIPDCKKELIFEESYSTSKTGGMGLGLYIARRTIERYGGNIFVRDNPEGGAIFEISMNSG